MALQRKYKADNTWSENHQREKIKNTKIQNFSISLEAQTDTMKNFFVFSFGLVLLRLGDIRVRLRWY